MIWYFLLAVAVLLLIFRPWTGLQRETPRDFAVQSPQFDPRRHLNGEMISEGIIYGPLGQVSSRFVARMRGEWYGSNGRLSESFSFAGGGQRERLWHLTLLNDGGFTAEADDIIGTASADFAGPAVKMRYRLRLPPSGGGHVLDVTDWLYLMENGTIMNRSEMRKFGLKVGELIATIRPAPS